VEEMTDVAGRHDTVLHARRLAVREEDIMVLLQR
jgi:hypothetical protein